MTFMNLIKLALAVMQFANWIAGRVSQEQWKASGFQDAALQYAKEFQNITGAADAAIDEARKLTPEQRKRILEE